MYAPQVFHSFSIHENEGKTKGTVNETFLKLARCLEEGELHVSASRIYITAAKHSIDNLKNCLTNAEVDINTAEECLLESDARLQRLREEMQSLFNRTFYQNLNTEEKSNGRHAQSNVVSIDEISLPQQVSLALQKYAEETNINLENYRTTFDRRNGLLFIVMNPKSTYLDGETPAASSHHNEAIDGETQLKFAGAVTNLHSRRLSLPTRNLATNMKNVRDMTNNRSEDIESSHLVENLFAFPTERSLAKGQTTGEKMSKHHRNDCNCDRTLSKSPEELEMSAFVLGHQATRESLQTGNNLPKKCTRWVTCPGDVSSFRLQHSNERLPTKLLNRYEHQSEAILVKIDKSDSENEHETVTKGNEMSKKYEERRPSPINSESEDLIKMSSSSGSSETTRLSTEETDNKNNSNENLQLHKLVNSTETLKLESRKDDLSRSSMSFRCEMNNTLSSRNNLPKSAAELSCRPKTFSSSPVNKGIGQPSKHALQAFSAISSDDSSNPFPQEYDIISDEESIFGLNFSSRLFNKSDKAKTNANDRTGCYSNKTKIKDRFDQLEAAACPKGLGERCYSDQLYRKKIGDGTDKCFSTSQCKNRRHTLTHDTISGKNNRTFHLGYSQKRPQSPLGSANGKVAASEQWNNLLRYSEDPFPDDENATTCNDATRDVFEGMNKYRNRSRTFSKSPSYASFPNEVFRHKQELEYSSASASTTIDMTFDSETEEPSFIDATSTSNGIDMSIDSETGFPFGVATYDESLSSLNADTSGSVCVEISEASINSISPRPIEETHSQSNDLPRSSQREQYESVTSRDSAESILTVYESSAGAGCFQSDEFSRTEIRNSAAENFSSSFDNSHQQSSSVTSTCYPISKHFISSYHARHSPKPDYSP